jgi:hypothetical protein
MGALADLGGARLLLAVGPMVGWVLGLTAHGLASSEHERLWW